MSRHLMARFRRHATGLVFPWQYDDREWKRGEYGGYRPDTEAYHAPLETGHRLVVWDDTVNDDDDFRFPKEPPGSHWKGGIEKGGINGPVIPEEFAKAGYPSDWHPEWTAVYEEDSPLRAKAYPSKEEAMRAVERRFREMNPIGSDTGGHDSGFDYDSFMRDYDPRKEY